MTRFSERFFVQCLTVPLQVTVVPVVCPVKPPPEESSIVNSCSGVQIRDEEQLNDMSARNEKMNAMGIRTDASFLGFIGGPLNIPTVHAAGKTLLLLSVTNSEIFRLLPLHHIHGA